MRGERDGGRGVAPEGLKQDGGRLDIKLPQLLGREKPVRVVAHEKRGRGIEALEAHGRLLQHGLLGRERQELLRMKLAR